MSLLDKASLVQIPSGYKEDKLYSVVPDSGAGDFTFSRSSTGTRVNADGYIEDAPWNLLNYSEDLTGANGWRQDLGLTTQLTTEINPIGVNSCYKTIADTNTNTHYTYSTNAIGNLSYFGGFCVSFYAKPNGYNWIRYYNNNNAFGVDINIVTGEIQNKREDSIGTILVEDAPNGWKKVSLQFDRLISYSYAMLKPMPTALGNSTFAGDGVSGMFLWGIQISKGLNFKPYIKRTDGFDVPRLDYSGGASCPTLLLEPQSTNLIDNSNTISNWTLQNVTTLLNQGTSPQNTQEAILISETNNNDNHISFGSISSLSSGSQYTYSGFVKQGTQRYAFFHLVLGSVRYGIIFDFVTKSVTDVEYIGTPINESYYFTEYNDGWFRLVISMQHSGGAAYPVIGLSNSPTPTYNSNAQPTYQGNSSKNIYVWGFQLEQGSLTSYIPTNGSTVTRTADVSETSGLSSLINSQEGVLFLEIAAFANDQTNRSISIYDGISTNGHLNRVQIGYFGSDQISFLYRTISGNVFLQNINVTQQQTNKFALKFKENDFSAYINGVKVAEQSSGSVAAVGTFTNIATHNGNNASNFFGKCNQLILFNQALTDSELETLTTI